MADDDVYDPDVYKAVTHAYKTVGQVRSIVDFVHNHAIVNEFFRQHRDKNQTELILDMKVRWNSTHSMIERFLMHQEIIKMIIGTPDRFGRYLKKKQLSKLRSLLLLNDDWELINTLYTVLQPFRQATTLLSTRTYPTLAMSHYIARAIEHFLTANEEDSSMTVLIKRSLRTQFIHYFDTSATQEQKQYARVCQ